MILTFTEVEEKGPPEFLEGWQLRKQYLENDVILRRSDDCKLFGKINQNLWCFDKGDVVESSDSCDSESDSD